MSKTQLQMPLSKSLNEKDIESIDSLIDDLGAMGIKIKASTPLAGGHLIFVYDKDAYKRNAGRKKKDIPSGSPLQDMNQDQVAKWLLDNPIETIEKELQVSRATAFRRRKEAQQHFSYGTISFPSKED